MLEELGGVMRNAVSVSATPVISADERDDANKKLDERIDTTDAATARLLFAEVKESVVRRQAAQRTIEGKATSVVDFASAGLAFETSFQSGALLRSGWALPAVVLLLLAVFAGVAVLLTRSISLPDAALYNTRDLVNGECSEARILSTLLEGWVESRRKIEASGTVRDARLRVAFATYVLGVVVVVASAVTDVMSR